MSRNRFLPVWAALAAPALVIATSTARADAPPFTAVQPELFSAPGGQANAWGDIDNDGDLDLAITFRDAPVRLYRNDDGRFVDIAAETGLDDSHGNTRSIAFADYDSDGDLDIFVAGSGHYEPPTRLWRNDLSNGVPAFTDVAAEANVALRGILRQVSFVDYDSDGDVDLYVAFRASVNRLLRNDDGVYTDVTRESGIGEPRRTVGACWFDMDADGDLDLFTANQNGDRDGVFLNEGGHFREAATELNMDSPRRPILDGGVGCAVTDFDTDGDLDLYVAAYGDDLLYRNNGDGSFTNVAPDMGVAIHDHIVTGVWGDIDHDGRPDLYTVGYISGKPRTPDYLFMNKGDRFENQLPANIAANDTDHGVQWVDYDQDGDLDLALAANDPAGSHPLYRNDLPADVARRSVQILVLDENGRYTKAGSEVRVYRADTTELLGLRLVDTGSGYNAQNAKPVHVGLPSDAPVDVRVTTMSPDGRKHTDFKGVNPRELGGKPFIARVGN